MEIKTGHSFTQEITVQHKDTAAVYGSGKLEVFATPAMVGLMENTAIKCLEGMLDDDSDTVGIEINTKHVKATAVGKKVACKATITEVDVSPSRHGMKPLQSVRPSMTALSSTRRNS